MVQARRNATAAKRFFKWLLSRLRYKLRGIVTDGFRSYGVTQRDILPEVRYRQSRYLNNRTEKLYQPPYGATGIRVIFCTWPPRQPHMHTGQPEGPPVSHRPTRRRERQMQRIKSPEQAPRFLSPRHSRYSSETRRSPVRTT